jgi:hypothetical protein
MKRPDRVRFQRINASTSCRLIVASKGVLPQPGRRFRFFRLGAANKQHPDRNPLEALAKGNGREVSSGSGGLTIVKSTSRNVILPIDSNDHTVVHGRVVERLTERQNRIVGTLRGSPNKEIARLPGRHQGSPASPLPKDRRLQSDGVAAQSFAADRFALGLKASDKRNC